MPTSAARCRLTLLLFLPALALAQGQPVAIEFDAARGLARQLFFVPQGAAQPLDAAPSDAALRARAETLLQRHHGTLFGTQRPTLELTRLRRSLSGSQIFHRQLHGGVEVEGASVVVRLDRAGEALSIESSVQPSLTLERLRPGLSLQRATEIARGEAGFTDRVPPRGRLVVLPRDGGRLAWRVELALWAPFVDWLAYVDAQSGELIERHDRMLHEKPVEPGFSLPVEPMRPWPQPEPIQFKVAVNGAGLVLPRNPLDGHPERYALRDGNAIIDTFRESLVLERLDGTGLLRGTYADVENADAPRANQPSLQFNYSSLVTNGNFHEVNVYWHVDVFQHYITTTLGVVGANDVMQLLRVHQGEDDNSSYSPGVDYIRFGDGGVDDSEDGEIVLHEYGHAVHDAISSLSFVFENSALSEGFGDYCAATFSGNPLVGEWDATSYNPGPPPYLRRTDLPLHYPEDVTGSIHETGQIMSSAWWDLRGTLGTELADRLIFESFFLFSSQGGFQDFADATQQVDLALYGGAHLVDIFDAYYVQHGIPLTSLLAAQHTPLTDTSDVSGPFTISARVASTRPLAAAQPVRLYHRFGGTTNWNETAMSSLGNGIWSTDIAGPGVRNDVEYYIRVVNDQTAESFSPSDAPLGFHSFEAGAGTPAPSIAHEHLRDLPLEAWPPRIVAQVQHDEGIESVQVRWAIATVSQPDVELVAQGDGRYEARLPAAPVRVGDWVRYEIVASSKAGGFASTDGPHDFVVLAPAHLLLQQNRPNPFNPSTEIVFVLPQRGEVRLVIYDLAGRAIRVLEDAPLDAGLHTRRWDGRDAQGRAVASGVYLYQLQTAAGTRSKRMTLLQ